MRKIKAYTVNIVWDDGKEESIHASHTVRDAIEDYLDDLEEEEYLSTITEEEVKCI